MTRDEAALSVIRGAPLAEEQGIGALTLGSFLREVTARFSSREAAVMWDGGTVERWSYTELWQRSQDVARSLIACGIGKGSRVGILMTNRLEFLASVFGIALAGGVATVLSTFSTGAELEQLLTKACCSVLLFERQVLKKDFEAILTDLEPALCDTPPGRLASIKFPYLRHLVGIGQGNERSVGIEGWPQFLGRSDAVSPALLEAATATVAPADPAVLFFSSGSTGTPKGILSAHRAVCLQFWRWRLAYAVGDDLRCWTSNGFFFSGNFAMGLGMTLAAGGSLILQRWFDPQEALSVMMRERATMLQAWPHQWAQFVSAPNWLEVDLSALKYIDAASPVAAHPTIHTHWRAPNQAYGSTETFTINAIFPSGTPESIHGNSSGAPLPGNVFKIVDPFTSATVRMGQRGEIALKGPTLMLGYLGVPLDETLDSDGFFHTGDGGYVDAAGRLFWEGRLTDIIKTGGVNVSPLEIDEVLRTCPGVKLCQTLGIPDALLGELVVACVVPHDGFSLSEDGIKAYARRTLASYKVPRRVLFLAETDLTLTGSNKIKTADLRVMVAKRLGGE